MTTQKTIAQLNLQGTWQERMDAYINDLRATGIAVEETGRKDEPFTQAGWFALDIRPLVRCRLYIALNRYGRLVAKFSARSGSEDMPYVSDEREFTEGKSNGFIAHLNVEIMRAAAEGVFKRAFAAAQSQTVAEHINVEFAAQGVSDKAVAKRLTDYSFVDGTFVEVKIRIPADANAIDIATAIAKLVK